MITITIMVECIAEGNRQKVTKVTGRFDEEHLIEFIHASDERIVGLRRRMWRCVNGIMFVILIFVVYFVIFGITVSNMVDN